MTLQVIQTAHSLLIKKSAIAKGQYEFEESKPQMIFGQAEAVKEAKKNYNKAKILLRDFHAASDNPMLQLSISEGHKKGLPICHAESTERARGAGIALGKKYKAKPAAAIINMVQKAMPKTKKELQAKDIATDLGIERITVFQALNYLANNGWVAKRKLGNGIYVWRKI